MSRDIDPRTEERERPDLGRGGRAGADDSRSSLAEDARDVFTRELDLPRGESRERVRIHAHDYTLRGSEVRALATVGAFRVVPSDEVRERQWKRPRRFPEGLGTSSEPRSQ